jgi:hypothetical protein
MTTTLNVYDALNAYLSANIGSIRGAVAAQVAYLGKTFVPEAETPYLSVHMPVLNQHMITTGTQGVNQWDGMLQVNCYWPIGTGTEEVTGQQDDVKALFPNGFSVETSDSFYLRFFAPNARPLLFDGAWVCGPVQMRWFLHDFVV